MTATRTASTDALGVGAQAPSRSQQRSPDGNARQALLATLPVSERRLQLAGVSTAVLEGGSGPPLILLHGPAGYAAHWMRVIPGLAAAHRVVAPDIPGHGASAVGGDVPLDAERMLAWLDELIEQTCASPPALIGHLAGGAIAARYALEHADRVSRLVLIDTFGLRPFEPAPEFGLALHSLVARAVKPEQYNEKPPLCCGYYTCWSGLPMHRRFEAYFRPPDRAFAAWPTQDDLTLIIGGWPFADLATYKQDIEGNYLKMFELAPSFSERVREARREARFVDTVVQNYFRKPYGPGWALVGDAGYNKDFITAQGIQDAFGDAERCAAAVDEALSGRRSFDASMGEYQSSRDRHAMPMYEFTCEFATLWRGVRTWLGSNISICWRRGSKVRACSVLTLEQRLE